MLWFYCFYDRCTLYTCELALCAYPLVSLVHVQSMRCGLHWSHCPHARPSCVGMRTTVGGVRAATGGIWRRCFRRQYTPPRSRVSCKWLFWSPNRTGRPVGRTHRRRSMLPRAEVPDVRPTPDTPDTSTRRLVMGVSAALHGSCAHMSWACGPAEFFK